MALDDIVGPDGDPANMVLDIPAGTLHAPLDILTEAGTGSGAMVLDTPLITGAAFPTIGGHHIIHIEGES